MKYVYEICNYHNETYGTLVRTEVVWFEMLLPYDVHGVFGTKDILACFKELSFLSPFQVSNLFPSGSGVFPMCAPQ